MCVTESVLLFFALLHVAIAQKLHLQLTRSVVCSNVRPTKPMGGGSRGRAVSGPCCFDQLNCWNLFFHCDKKLLLLKSFCGDNRDIEPPTQNTVIP